MMKPWKLHDSAVAFDNPWMKIRQDSVETLSFSKDELLHAIYTGEIWVTGTISAAFLAFHALDMRNATYQQHLHTREAM